MSGFFGRNEPKGWSGLLKQAISVTSKTPLIPSLNEINQIWRRYVILLGLNRLIREEKDSSDQEIQTPISGVVTVVKREKKIEPERPASTTPPVRQRRDISSRLAAAVAEKNPRSSSGQIDRRTKTNETRSVDQSSTTQNTANVVSGDSAVKPIEDTLDKGEKPLPENADENSLSDKVDEASPSDKVNEGSSDDNVNENSVSESSPKDVPSDSTSDGLADKDEQSARDTTAITDIHLEKDELTELSRQDDDTLSNITGAIESQDGDRTTLALQERENSYWR